MSSLYETIGGLTLPVDLTPVRADRTLTSLDNTLANAARIFPSIDPDVKFDADRMTYHFKSGYRYQFGHCKDPSDYVRYQGSEYTWIGFDELTAFLEEQYLNIILRLRTTDPVLGAKNEDGSDFTSGHARRMSVEELRSYL